MTILSTKLRNLINQNCQGDRFEYHLKNISLNGHKLGCSGFIVNPANGSTVYVATDTGVVKGFMYRFAKNIKDYRGGVNRWAYTLEDYVNDIINLLKTVPDEKEFGTY